MPPLTEKRFDLVTWVLIYVGMALATVGLFVGDGDAGWSTGLLIIGVVLLALGIGGVLFRARQRDPK